MFSDQSNRIPVIDITSLRTGADPRNVVAHIQRACAHNGFFYITGHGVDQELLERLQRLSVEFFAQSEEFKSKIGMKRGGRAWRGFFPVGDELTSGKPDQKEGIYFGAELDAADPRVLAGLPLHGANLFPAIAQFRETVLEYLEQMTRLGHNLMSGIALSLDLDADFFRRELTWDPTILFRIFHYPPLPPSQDDSLWSVGEHTDYGLLTILKQDQTGGLQVKSQGEWIEASPIPDTFVCNIGDMLDKMTGGHYRSTPHRVRNLADRGRLSFPFFFDPSWEANVQSIMRRRQDADAERWDGTQLQEIKGTYGDYLLQKVARVFPELSRE